MQNPNLSKEEVARKHAIRWDFAGEALKAGQGRLAGLVRWQTGCNGMMKQAHQLSLCDLVLFLAI
jgi:hypothetical protein